MHRRLPSALLAAPVAVVIAACGGVAPSPSSSIPASAGPSATPAACGDLPPRTSEETDFPFPALHINGDDLPPVVGTVEWTGDGERVTHEPSRPVHLQVFTVLQARGQTEISLRMTDGVEIGAWRVDVVPASRFRIGDFETDRSTWSEGEGPTGLVCVPVTEGSWGIIGEITFAGGAGSGTYYWRLNLTEVPTA